MVKIFKPDNCCWEIEKRIIENQNYYYSFSCPHLFMVDFDDKDLSIIYNLLMDFDQMIAPQNSLWAIFSSNSGYHAVLLSEELDIRNKSLVDKYTKVLKGDSKFIHISFQAVKYLHRFSRIFKKNEEPIPNTQPPFLIAFYGDPNKANADCIKRASIFYSLISDSKFDGPNLTKEMFEHFPLHTLHPIKPTLVIKLEDKSMEQILQEIFKILDATKDLHWKCHQTCYNIYNKLVYASPLPSPTVKPVNINNHGYTVYYHSQEVTKQPSSYYSYYYSQSTDPPSYSKEDYVKPKVLSSRYYQSADDSSTTTAKPTYYYHNDDHHETTAKPTYYYHDDSHDHHETTAKPTYYYHDDSHDHHETTAQPTYSSHEHHHMMMTPIPSKKLAYSRKVMDEAMPDKNINEKALASAMNMCNQNCGKQAMGKMSMLFGDPALYKMDLDAYSQLDALNHQYWVKKDTNKYKINFFHLFAIKIIEKKK